MTLRATFTLFFLAISTPLFAAVSVQEVTSPKGLKAWLVEESTIPFVALEIRFRGGAALDAPGKRGAIYLMTGLLEEGAGDLDAQGFAVRREDLAASFSYRVFDDTLAISARMLTENRDEAIALLKLSLHQPTFEQSAIDRVREQVLSGIRSDKTNPSALAGDAFNKAAWGNHPYGLSREGTEESVNALTRDDMFDAYERVFARDRVFVSAVGDISAKELAALMDELLGELPETGSAPLQGRATYGLTGDTSVIDFATPQSIAVFGHQGLPRDHPDYMAAYVINEIFGGSGLESRLMREVREKRGLTYGVSTFLLPMDSGELVIGSLRSDNAKMAEALALIREEWARLASDGITAEELDEAKTHLTGAYALRFDGNANIARILIGMQMVGLPIDYITTRNDQINALTLEDINRVARALFDPDALHVVVVGQPDGL